MLTGKDLEGSSQKALSQIMPEDLRKTPKAHHDSWSQGQG
jgi:hypothetical protein